MCLTVTLMRIHLFIFILYFYFVYLVPFLFDATISGEIKIVVYWTENLQCIFTSTSIHSVEGTLCPIAVQAVTLCLAVILNLNGSAPAYLWSYFTRVTDVPSRRRLRSASSSQLAIPSFNFSTVGKRAFPVSGANFWNSLPSHVTGAPSLAVFRQRLKTFLFHLSYPDLFSDFPPTSLWTLR